MQRVQRSTSYAEAIEIFLDRVAGDVWTVEMKDRDYADLELFRPYRDRMKKKIALGVVSHRSLQVETPEEVAEDVRYALNYIDAAEARAHVGLRLRPAGPTGCRLLQGHVDRPGSEHRADGSSASRSRGSAQPTPPCRSTCRAAQLPTASRRLM